MPSIFNYSNLFAGNPQVAPLPPALVDSLAENYKISVRPFVFRATTTENYQGTTDGAGATTLVSAGFSIGTPIVIFQMHTLAWMLPGFTITSMILQAGISFSASTQGAYVLSSSAPLLNVGAVDFVLTKPVNLTGEAWENWLNPATPILIDPAYSTGGIRNQAFGAVASSYRYQVRYDVDFALAAPLS